MNPIENLWAALARRVYHNARQFGSLVDLREGTFEEREKVGDEVLHIHFNSMQRRCFALLA